MDARIISLNKLHTELRGFRIEVGKAPDGIDVDSLLGAAERCTVVKHNPRRQVYRIQAGGEEFFLKRTTLVRPKDRLRLALLHNRKKAEWRNLYRLQALDIAAPVPVMFGDAPDRRPPQFFMITRKVDGHSLTAGCSTAAAALGGFIARLHRSGVYHADLHPNNLMVTDDGRHAVLDAQSVFSLPWLPRWLRLYNLGRLWLDLPGDLHNSQWAVAFLDAYNGADSRPIRKREITRTVNRQQQRRYRSRARRCVKDSTLFTRVAAHGMRGFRRRDFELIPDRVPAALAAGTPLKAGSVIVHEGVCVKYHRRRMLHRDRCLNSWLMSHALSVRAIAVAPALAYFVAGTRSFFLSEYMSDGQRLNDYLSSLEGQRAKRGALKKLALWVKAIHRHRIRQRDFKSSNILCRCGDYFMVDLDGVRIGKITETHIVTSLAQLNASVSNAIERSDRLRFLHYYLTGESWSRNRRRKACRRIWEISKSKNTSIYNLDLDKL